MGAWRLRRYTLAAVASVLLGMASSALLVMVSANPWVSALDWASVCVWAVTGAITVRNLRRAA